MNLEVGACIFCGRVSSVIYSEVIEGILDSIATMDEPDWSGDALGLLQRLQSLLAPAKAARITVGLK